MDPINHNDSTRSDIPLSHTNQFKVTGEPPTLADYKATPSPCPSQCDRNSGLKYERDHDHDYDHDRSRDRDRDNDRSEGTSLKSDIEELRSTGTGTLGDSSGTHTLTSNASTHNSKITATESETPFRKTVTVTEHVQK